MSRKWISAISAGRVRCSSTRCYHRWCLSEPRRQLLGEPRSMASPSQLAPSTPQIRLIYHASRSYLACPRPHRCEPSAGTTFILIVFAHCCIMIYIFPHSCVVSVSYVVAGSASSPRWAAVLRAQAVCSAGAQASPARSAQESVNRTRTSPAAGDAEGDSRGIIHSAAG